MQNTIQLSTRLVVKPKSKSQLAGEYGVNRATVRRWCEMLGIDTKGRLLSILQVAHIYQTQGAPGMYEQQMTLNF